MVNTSRRHQAAILEIVSKVASTGSELEFRVHNISRNLSHATLKARIAAGEAVAGPEVLRMLGGGSELFPAAADIARSAEERGEFVAAESLAAVYLREAAFVKAPPARVV